MHRLLIILVTFFFATHSIEAVSKRPRKASRKATATTVAKTKAKPRTEGLFITRVDQPSWPGGLQGRNIALWASHGRFFDLNDNRWKWQRSRIFGTVEDLYTASYAYSFIAPMLENAGACVMMPRERDTSSIEIIVDADGAMAQDGCIYTNGKHQWHISSSTPGFAYSEKTLSPGSNPFTQGTVMEAETVSSTTHTSVYSWCADIPQAGEYAVYVSYASLPSSAPDAIYTIHSAQGTEEIKVNQTMGGGTWIYLGTYPLEKGKRPVVSLSNMSAAPHKTVTADAVKIGGGMGSVSRGGILDDGTSGYPRFTEGARYWLQWAGMPSSIYSISDGANDYEDDLKARALWVNYLSGGSKSLPGHPGLGIPIDLSLAIHSDAGATDSPSDYIGTLPIVSTSGGPLGDGRSRKTSAALASAITSQIVDDIWRLYDPAWTRRKLRDKAYHEVREPLVPAAIIELLSHQNFADMRLGLDPGFRFDISRSIYKGILKHLHSATGSPYTVQPLPVKAVEISGTDGVYRLKWQPAPDPLEPTAMPDHYIVYERVENGHFTELAITDDPWLDISPEDDRIYSYRIVASNKGGTSFPSETLSLCYLPGSQSQVTIVNAFTRISGPVHVYTESGVGFDYRDDFGVPWGCDIHFTGEQTEFRPTRQWLSNDAPGHGASRADYETSIVCGNTQDFTVVHGRAIRDAGYSFVSTSAEAFSTAHDTPSMVDIIFGNQKEIPASHDGATRFKPFTQTLKSRLSQLAGQGTSIMLSGSHWASDLLDNPFSTTSQAADDRKFAHDILGIKHCQGNATLTGCIRVLKGRLPQFDRYNELNFNQQLNSRCYAVQSPESFKPINDVTGEIVMTYSENDYPAVCAVDLAGYRVFAMGFPFETILDANHRSQLMGQILHYLTSTKQFKYTVLPAETK